MARPRAIKPRQQTGKPGWIATFTNSAGHRSTRGLGTRSEVEATLICAGLQQLIRMGCSQPGDAAPSTPLKSLELYFGKDRVSTDRRVPIAELRPEDTALTDSELDQVPEHIRGKVFNLQMTHQQMLIEVGALRLGLARAEERLRVLQASTLGRAVEASANCPKMPAALAEFGQHMQSTASPKHAREAVRIAQLFASQLPAQTGTPAQITADQISRWLDEDAAGSTSPVTRRAKRRIMVGLFINWSARLYGYASPMSQIKSATKQQLDRERGGIEWHDLAEVTAALEQLPDDYWRAVVATLAFAGLRLAELVWLRVSDFQAAGDRHQLWITSVDDGHGERHDLKTGHSKRAVDVSQARLLPLLEAHLEASAGELFLFPIHPGVKRRKRATGHSERWDPGSLSRKLSGIPWRKQAGVLPDGMTARSLRRTFGSLLLRSGRSVAEVAAAMGNTPAVVQQHYARILGSEVSVDF